MGWVDNVKIYHRGRQVVERYDRCVNEEHWVGLSSYKRASTFVPEEGSVRNERESGRTLGAFIRNVDAMSVVRREGQHEAPACAWTVNTASTCGVHRSAGTDIISGAIILVIV